MAGRAHGAEGVEQFAGEHRVGGVDGGAGGHQDRVPGVDVDGRVRIDLRVRRATGGDLVAQPVGEAAQRRQVHAPMGQFQVGHRGGCGLAALQRVVEPGDEQAVLDRVKPLRAFGMPVAHLVSPTILVGEKAGGLTHGGFTVWFAACTPTQKYTNFWFSLTR